MRDAQEFRELLGGISNENKAQFNHVQRQLEEATKMLEARVATFRDDLFSSINAAELRAKRDLAEENSARRTWEQGSSAKIGELVAENKREAESLGECARRAHTELEEVRSQLQAEVHLCQRHIEEQRTSLLNAISEQTRGLETRGRVTADELAQTRASLEGLLNEFRTSRRETEDDRHKLMLRLDEDNRKQALALEQAVNMVQQQTEDVKSEAISFARKQTDDARAVLRVLVENATTETHQTFQRDLSQVNSRLDASAEAISRRVDAVTALVEAKGARAEEIKVELQAAVQGEQRRSEDLGAQMTQKQDDIAKFFNEELQVCSRRWEDKHLEITRAIDHSKQTLELRVEAVQANTGAVRNELLESVRCVEKEAVITKEGLQAQAAQLQSNISTLRDMLNSEIQATIQRLVQEGERVDAQILHVTEEFQCALRTNHEHVRGDQTRIRAEFQELLSQLDQRLQRSHDTNTARLDQVGAQITAVQVDSRAHDGQTKEALAALNLGVDRAQNNAAEAKRQASTSELTTRETLNAFHETEIRCLTEGLAKVRLATGSLSSGVMKIAQTVGLLPSHDARNEAISEVGTPIVPRWDKVDLQDLLEWEKVGNSLADRIGKAWQPLISGNCTTIVDMIQRKAESATMKLLQMAIRDLDVRISGVVGERDAWRDLGLNNFNGIKTPAAASSGRAVAAAQSFGTSFGPASRIAFGLETGNSPRQNGATGFETIAGWGQPETPTAAPSMMSPLSSMANSSFKFDGCVAPKGDPLVLARIAAYGDGASGRSFRAEETVEEFHRPPGPRPEGDPRHRHFGHRGVVSS